MILKAFLFLCGLVSVRCLASPSLEGTWRYDGFFYQGHRYENPNPDLTLTFTFLNNGLDRLYWARVGDNGFCEREAHYTSADNQLYQQVTWVNPKNRSECSKDPDMNLGAESLVNFEVLEDELHLLLELKGEPFHYILRRCFPGESNCPTGSL